MSVGLWAGKRERVCKCNYFKDWEYMKSKKIKKLL